jgi:hypothetical protein
MSTWAISVRRNCPFQNLLKRILARRILVENRTSRCCIAPRGLQSAKEALSLPAGLLHGPVGHYLQSNRSDRVEVLAVNIDDSKDVPYSYAGRRGWTHVRHFWTGDSDDKGFESPAANKFGINGVPTAILIDPAGKIIWRGHPRDHNCETQIDRLLRISGAKSPRL